MKLIFSSAALAVLGNSPKMRVRTADMTDYVELQIRPTDRSSAANIPKNEQLVDVQTAEGPAGTGGEFIEIDEAHGAALVDVIELFVVQSRKHGWYALSAVRPAGATPPVVTRN